MTRNPLAGAPRGAKRPAWYHVGPVLALAPAADAPPASGDEQATTSTADVYVYDTIGGWLGLTSEDFVTDVASLDVDQIVLHLNSPGGDASEGVAIANVLRAHRARVVVRVDGMAASAASVIAMAGDEVVMGLGAQMMVHDAWGFSMGNAAEMAAAQRMLDSTSDALASTYAARAGGTTEEWRAVMRAETWYTAEEAVTAGLADRVAAADETGTAEGEQITPGAGSYGGFWDMWDSLQKPDRFDLSAFTYAGRDGAPAPAMPGRKTPAASAAGSPTTPRSGDVPNFLDDVRQRLGVATDADEATTLSALDEALEERADDEDDDEAEGAAAQLPDGVVAVEAETLAQLRADAQLGREAHSRQQRDDRQALVDAAVGDGRIAPARRAAWLKQLEADPGAAATLASLEKGLVPIGELIGHSGDGDDDADALYASIFGKES